MHIDPLAAGFSQTKLDKLAEHLDTRYVQPGKIPGVPSFGFQTRGHRTLQHAGPDGYRTPQTDA